MNATRVTASPRRALALVDHLPGRCLACGAATVRLVASSASPAGADTAWCVQCDTLYGTAL